MDDDFIRLTFKLKKPGWIAYWEKSVPVILGMSQSRDAAFSQVSDTSIELWTRSCCPLYICCRNSILYSSHENVFGISRNCCVQRAVAVESPLVSKEGFTRFYESDLTKNCGKMRFGEEVGILEKKLNVGEHGMVPKFAFLAIQKLMTSFRQDLVSVNMINSNLIGCAR